MSPTPFFTIIVPCLNEEKALPKLLGDLQKQTYTDFEVIVVDGKSEDTTQKIVKALHKEDERFHLVVSDVRNVGYQRNLGANEAQGTYLLFFDADNRLPPFFLAGVHYICVRDNLDAFTSAIDADSDNTQDIVFARLSNLLQENAAKLNQPLAYGSCIGCKKTVFKKVKGFDEAVMFGEDTEFVRRVAKSGFSFVFLKEPSYVYSLRRFRKEGTLTLMRKTAPMGLKMLLNKKNTDAEIYPMFGGNYFAGSQRKKKKSQTFVQLEELVKTLKMIVGN